MSPELLLRIPSLLPVRRERIAFFTTITIWTLMVLIHLPPPATPTTPESAASAGLSNAIPGDLEGDTIICEAPPGHEDWDSEDDADMEDIPSPTFNNTPMTETEKAEATERWTIHRNKHEKRKRQKNSYVSRLIPFPKSSTVTRHSNFLSI
jgi:hypothetical protein